MDSAAIIVQEDDMARRTKGSAEVGGYPVHHPVRRCIG